MKSYEERVSEMRAFALTIPEYDRATWYQALYTNMSVRKCVEKGLLPASASTMGDWFILSCVLADMLGPAYVAADARAALIELGADVGEVAANGL